MSDKIRSFVQVFFEYLFVLVSFGWWFLVPFLPFSLAVSISFGVWLIMTVGISAVLSKKPEPEDIQERENAIRYGALPMILIGGIYVLILYYGGW